MKQTQKNIKIIIFLRRVVILCITNYTSVCYVLKIQPDCEYKIEYRTKLDFSKNCIANS